MTQRIEEGDVDLRIDVPPDCRRRWLRIHKAKVELGRIALEFHSESAGADGAEDGGDETA